MILGIEVLLLYVLLWKYYWTRKLAFIFFSMLVIVSIVASKGVRLGTITAFESVLVFALVVIGIVSSDRFKAKGIGENVNRALAILISLAIIVLFGLIILQQFSNTGDSFHKDVASTYIKNLYGTSRYSVLGFMDLSVMHFLYLNVVLFFIFNKKMERNSYVYVSILGFSLLYIIVVGILYVYKWGAENIAVNGEYLTGFDSHMATITVLAGCFWGYVILERLLPRSKEWFCKAKG